MGDVDQIALAEPHPVDLPLSLPAAPVEPERPGFPLLATLAPVAGALALWAITGSAFALVFAALGPVVAIASVLDAKRQTRRRRRRARAERASALERLRAEIGTRHDAERRAAWRRSPSPTALVTNRLRPVWQAGALPAIVVGSGPARSSLRIDGAPADADDHRLLARAASLDAAPVLADPYGGIGFVGAAPLVRAAARAALVQCAHHGLPGELGFEVPPSAEEWAWARRLPHSATGADVLRIIDRADADADVTGEHAPPVHRGWGSRASSPSRTAEIVVAAEEAVLPPGLQTIVRVDGPRTAVVSWGGAAAPVQVVPALVGDAEALAWAESAALLAHGAGLGSVGAGLPTRVALAELAQPSEPGSARNGLAVAVGAAADGPLVIDLVRHGPHALVAGTTGSGKSEFLLAWLTGLARTHPPDRLAFLLVDFKGGAAFEPIRDLPHVTGVVTDLDEAEAERAVQSLRAELRHRERVLQQAGARDIRSLDERVDLARLVIVVDEFQAMIERFPDLGAVISDIAARGRSLGVHLVLASQRPNGVVREQITANCAIRVSLRVMQRADSLAVVGTEQAAEIAPDTPGRGIVDRGDGCPVLFQSAVADEAALTAARMANAAMALARRPWLDPLPRRIRADELDSLVSSASDMVAGGTTLDDGRDTTVAEAFVFGVADDPNHQRRLRAAWAPAADGHLLVLGASGSGRSTALAAVDVAVTAALGARSVLALDGPRSAVWDTLQGLLAAVRAGDDCPRLLVIDDLDIRFRSWPDDYRLAALDVVEALQREGRARGLGVAASASQSLGLGAGVRDGFGACLLLRHPTRSDLVQSGGAGDLWRLDDPPGAGQWRGHRLQIVETSARSSVGHPVDPLLDLRVDRVHAIVTRSPNADAARVRSAGRDPVLITTLAEGAARAGLHSGGDGPGPVFVGDADAWAANWALAARIREEAVIVVNGGPGEYRVLLRDRTLPPLLDEGSGQCWVRMPGEEARRFRWPAH